MTVRASGFALAMPAELPFTSRDRLDGAEQFAAGPPGAPRFTVTRYLMNRPGHGLTVPSRSTDAFMAAVHLRPFPGHDQWRDGRHVRAQPHALGALSLYDLEPSWITDLPDPFHTVNFHLPRVVFDNLTDELRAPRVPMLAVPGGSGSDEVMTHLALALQPALARPAEASPLFIDHILAAVVLHLARRYGDLRPRGTVPRGGLAPWQERRAKELLAGDLGGRVTLAELAGACGLSVSHFLRAFRRSAGLTPHRWLQEQRLATARRLLAGTEQALAEIASAAGFADQSHFTRVFSKSVGVSPGAWRRRLG